MRKLLFITGLLALLCIPASAQLTQQGQEKFLNCTSASCVLTTPGAPVNPNLLVNSGVNTFVIGVAPTTNAVRLYITNDTANSCNNITVSMASSGNSSISSFNSNPQAWQSLQVSAAGGAFVGSSPITLPSLGTVAVTSQPIIGTRVTIFVVLSVGCATTNVDIQAVFGTFSPPVSAVQGVVPAGGAASGENPILIAGKDVANNVRVATVIDHTVLGSQVDGLSIGGNDVSNGAQFGTFRTPAGSGSGPLAVSSMYLTPNGANTTQPRTSVGSLSGSCFNGNSCTGLQVSDTGYDTTVSLGVSTGGGSIGLWQSDNFPVNNEAGSKFETCHFAAKSVNTGGTSPTVDVYIQDSGDGSQYDDRIHFGSLNGAVSVPVYQFAGIAGTSTNMAVHAPQDAVLASNTIVSGPIGMIGRMKIVTGGTSPAYTVTIQMSCK